jgi:hypothetical protein
MAQAPQTPPRPSPPPPPARGVTQASNGPPKPLSTQETLKQRMEEQAAAFQRVDDAAYERATMGVGDDEDLRDKLLALGADVTRASPAREQPLPDAVPGLTTTTGAYRCPIDPTTAAVPAPEDSEIAIRMRGFPTVGSGREGGGPEKLFMKRENALLDE